MTGSSKQHTCSISDHQSELCMHSGLCGNLFFVLNYFPIVVGIMCRRHGCECRIYYQFIVIDVRIYNK